MQKSSKQSNTRPTTAGLTDWPRDCLQGLQTHSLNRVTSQEYRGLAQDFDDNIRCEGFALQGTISTAETSEAQAQKTENGR